jgi:hypothetical protein
MMNTARTTADLTAARAEEPHIGVKQSTPPTGRPPSGRNRLVTWLADKMRSAGNRIFLGDDARAIDSGWQITQGKLGLSRTYRDPRFDALCACDKCYGSGRAADQRCHRCSGTGRITLALGKVSPPEQGLDR